MPKINLTGDSWDFLRGLVRDPETETSTVPKKPNGAAAHQNDDDDDGDNGDEEPTQDWREWRRYARERGRRSSEYRTQRNQTRAELEAERQARAADKAKFDADMAALRTESENARTAAIAEAAAKGDQRLIRFELKAALKDAGCKEVDDALKLIDASAIKLNEAGDVTGVKEVIDQLKTSKAYLFDGAASSTTSSTVKAPDASDPQPKKATDMTAEEYAAARAAFTKSRRRF